MRHTRILGTPTGRRRLRQLAVLVPAAAAGLAIGATPASAFTLNVNFQPSSSSVPQGFVADTGQPYSDSPTYGWVREDSLGATTRVPISVADRTRERTASGVSLELRTLVHMNAVPNSPAAPPQPNAAWQAKVPNGNYLVKVAAGDPTSFDSTHTVRLEGQVALAFPATTTDRARTAIKAVTVNDGYLTVDSIGGTNTKLQYLQIATASTSTQRFNFQPTTAPVPTGFTKDIGAAYSTTSGFGWVSAASLTGTHTGVDLTGNTRDRDALTDQRFDTFIHMQAPAGSGNTTPGAWELAAPNGTYDVTVGVGDPIRFDSLHTIAIEGVPAVTGFEPSQGDEFRSVSRTVTVTDGRLTISPVGGTNTKLSFVEVRTGQPGARPSVLQLSPADGEQQVSRDDPILADLTLPAGGIDASTLTPSSVTLQKVSDGSPVAANLNTSAAGDSIVLTPKALLEKLTQYRVVITNDVRDVSGNDFKPTTSVFTTSSADPVVNTSARFQKSVQNTGDKTASLTMSPQKGFLYATTLQGNILRFKVNAATGALTEKTVIPTIALAEGGPRHILGLAFDPAATDANPILWVSHSQAVTENAQDWAGKITRLSGANLTVARNVVVNLPRAARDHETNSLAFGPDGALYVTQGSNSATGAPDAGWSLRPERTLSAAVLRIDVTAIPGTLDAKTSEGGTYSPFAVGAPVTIYASGVRNAFDLVWKGTDLYVPVNGSAAGGNTPTSPSTLPAACNQRLDFASKGPFTGPAVAGQTSLPAQPDLLFRVQKGGYYGHPNPARCEYTFFGGNPTAGADPQEMTKYPVGTLPDRNFRQASFSFGLHFSPNGALIYQHAGALQGKLLVARYSAGDDIVALSIDPTTKEISGMEDGFPGFEALNSPLDVAEDSRSGNVYVTELGTAPSFNDAQISLLRPIP